MSTEKDKKETRPTIPFAAQEQSKSNEDLMADKVSEDKRLFLRSFRSLTQLVDLPVLPREVLKKVEEECLQASSDNKRKRHPGPRKMNSLINDLETVDEIVCMITVDEKLYYLSKIIQ
jgi:hypothetical protein